MLECNKSSEMGNTVGLSALRIQGKKPLNPTKLNLNNENLVNVIKFLKSPTA